MKPHQRIPPAVDRPARPSDEGVTVPPRPPRKTAGSGEPPPPTSLAKALLWAVGVVLTVALALPLLSILALRFVPPPVTAFMLQSPTKPVQYDWVPAERIAEVARLAVVASEDQKFFDHRGFDFEAISQAMDENQRRAQPRGASTISQQVAKNLFLWPGGGMFRKGVEAGFTVIIELLWPKQRILEVYLNIAEFAPGIYGIEAAAQTVFNKPASELNANEAARLAAVLPSPRNWSATEPGEYVQRRTRWILGQMGHRDRTVDEQSQPSPSAGRPWWEGETQQADPQADAPDRELDEEGIGDFRSVLPQRDGEPVPVTGPSTDDEP
jgi:monofunctional biosynthetic peptidoglycan transglycosylase